MRAITFQGVERLAYESVPDPEIREGTDAVVRVAAAGICGSDLHPYFGSEVGLDPGTVMGHELVGEVVEVGRDVRRHSVGDRVTAPFTTSCGACYYCGIGLTSRCDRGQLLGWREKGVGLHGAQAELVRVPLADASLVPAPAGLDDALAVLVADVLPTALFGVHVGGIGAGEVVAVIGCGPVGLLAVRAALEAGAAEVVAVDRVPSRLALAEAFGATAVDLDGGDPALAVEERSGGRGADVAIEAVGSPEATRTAADVVRTGGSIVAVGVHVEPHLAISPGEIYDRNLRYVGGRAPARRYMPEALRMAERDADLLAPLISHRLPLSRGVDAYRRFAAREAGWAKVVLIPEE